MRNSAFLLTFNLASLLTFIYNYATSRASAHGVHAATGHSVACNEHDMTATWFKHLFSGDLYRLQLYDDENYRYQSNATHIWITIDFDRSGTAIIEHNDVIILKNTVKIYARNSSANALIIREDLYRYNLQCVFPRHAHASSVKGYRVTQHALKTINTTVVTKTFDVALDIFNSSRFDTKMKNPIKMSMNTPVYVEIKRLGSKSKHFKMVVQQCFASPYPNQTINEFAYLFFHKRCIYDSSLRISEATDSYFRFSIDAFQLKQGVNISDVIYLHCKNSICKKNSTSSYCLQTCADKNAEKRNSLKDDILRSVSPDKNPEEIIKKTITIWSNRVSSSTQKSLLSVQDSEEFDNKHFFNISGLEEVQHTTSAQISFALKGNAAQSKEPGKKTDRTRFMTSQSIQSIVEGKMKYVFIGLFLFVLVLVVVKVVHYYKCCYQGIEA